MWVNTWAGCVALFFDCFSEKPKLSNVPNVNTWLDVGNWLSS